MIARVNESHVGRGYDPYNSADQPYILAELSVKRYNSMVDSMMRRGFKYMREHPQMSADILAAGLERTREKFPPI